MKKLIFDLQRFTEPEPAETVTLTYDDGDGVVTGKDGEDTLFTISGVKSAGGLTYNAGTITVAANADALNGEDITIENAEGGEYTYALAYGGTAPTYAWTGTNGSKVAEYKRDAGYSLDSTSGDIVYTDSDTKVKLTFTSTVATISDLANYLEVDKAGAEGKITVKKNSGGNILANGFSITSGDYTIALDTETVGETTQPIGKFKATATNLNQLGSTVTVTGTWTAGYWLDSTNKKLSYAAATNATDSSKTVTLATIKGVTTDTLDVSALTGKDIEINNTTGQITLKAKDLNQKTVTITETKAPDSKTTGNYTFFLDDDVSKLTTATETVHDEETGEDKTVTTTNPPDAKDIWELNTAKTQATYKNVTPAYYTVASGSKSVTYTAQKTNATYGIIKGLTSSPVSTIDGGTATIAVYDVTTGSGAEAVTTSTLGVVSHKAGADPEYSSATGITVTEPAAGKYTFTVNGNVLPITAATITLSGAPTGSKLELGTGAEAQKASEASWNVSSGVATLNAKLSNGYTLASNDTAIKSFAAVTTATPLVVINGLKTDIDSTVGGFDFTDYVEIEGYNASTATAGSDTGKLATADFGEEGDGVITIKLKPAALTNKNVTVTSKTPSFQYELALDNDAQLAPDTSAGETGNGTIPRTKDIWVFSGTTATYKQVQPEYWTLDNGKITYHKQTDVQTYATIKGLDATKIATLKYSTDGDKVGTELSDGADGSEDEGKKVVAADKLAIEVDGNTIKLNKKVLVDTETGSNVTLVRGAGGGSMVLDIVTDDNTANQAAINVAEPDITAKWWTVDGAGKATLHQATQAGYKVEPTGLAIKYYAANTDKTLAEVNGLSTDVTVLKTTDGTTFAALDDGTATDGVALGIAGTTPAHKTFSAYNASNTPKYTFVTTKNPKQEIVLTDAMLADKKVTLTDRDTKDNDEFKLVLSTAGTDDPATEPTAAKSWAIAGTDANNITLTYQSYKKGYYTEVNDNTINYTKDGAKTKLFTLTVKNANRATGKYRNADGVVIDSETVDGVLQVDARADGAENADWENFVTVNTATQTVNVTANAASTQANNSIAFKANSTDYSDYKLVNNTSSSVEYGTPTWDATGNTATLSIAPTDATKNGYELSGDEKTLTYISARTDLLRLTGLKATSNETEATALETALATAYDAATKTVTLTKDVLSTTKVQLATLNKDAYTLALDGAVPQEAGVEGYTWTVSNGTSDDVKNVVAKKVEQAYYSNTNLTTIAYYKPVVKETLFTINGLNAAVANKEDNDAEDFTLTDKTDSTDYITFDASTSEVTVNETLLPTAAGDVVTLKGTGWKFAGVTEPEFNGTASWTISNGTATLQMMPTEGWKATNNGQKLTRVTATAQTLLTISGLSTDTTVATNINTLLEDAYDPIEHKVTLPKEVLGETATKIKLTPDSTSVFKGDGYTLALADDVATATTVANAWVKDSNNNLVFKSVGATGYFSSDTATSFTYHKESGAQTVFTLQNNGLLDSDTYAAAILTDKDGDAVLTKADGTTLISVNTATDSYKVSLSDAAFVATGSSSGEKNGGYDEYVTLKNGSGKSYTLELGDISAPVYNDGTWTETAAHSTTYTLTRKATSGGYELSDSNRKLTYVATNDTETALQVSGIASDSTLTEDSNIDFDGTNNSVTILKKELLNPTKIALKSLDGGTYTLKLSTDEIRQTVADAAGYIWKLTDGKIEAKYGTRTYYSSDTSETSFTYHAETPSESLFTISYTGNPTALYSGTPSAFTAFTDDDGDNILNNGDAQYLSFDTDNSKVTVLDETNILPTTANGNTFKISNGDYTFEDNVTTPLYDDTAATWAKATDATVATLSITPSNVGYTLTNSDKTLTYVAADSETLATLSGLASDLTVTSLQSGAEVSVDGKTITLSENVLKNRSGNKLSVNNGYTLAIDSSADVQIGSDSATTNIWQLGTNDNTKAYYRTVSPEYYTVNGNVITYNAPVQSGNDLLAISGLKAGTTAVEGEITGISINAESDTDGKYVVSIASTNLGTDTAAITTGSATYKFELSDNASALSNPAWEYNNATGDITLKGTYSINKYILSADGQTIEKISSERENTVQTLAVIKGVKEGFGEALDTSGEVAANFDVDYDSRVITFKDDSLLKTATTISISGDFFNYGLGLDTSEINTATDTGGTTWTFTPDGSTATYKTITEAYYTLATDTKSITATAQSSNTALVIVTGLNVDTDTYEWSASTESNAYTLKKKNNSTYAAGVDAISFDAATSEVTLKDAVLPTGAAAATVSVNAGTLAFDISSAVNQEAQFSSYAANQAANANVFNITATRSEFYTLSSDTKSITFTPESEAFLVASLSGIKAVGTALNDNIANANTAYNHIKVDTDNGEITVANAALTNSDVTLTTTQGYKLVLDDDVNTSTDAKDTWTFDSGSATYKNSVAEHYALTTSDTVIDYTAASDTKTYFTITGLKNTDVTDDKLSAGTDAYGDSIIRKGSGTTSVVEFDGNDTITLSLAALPEDDTVQITKPSNNSTSYKLALADDVVATTFYTTEAEATAADKEVGDVKVLGKSTQGTPALGITSTSRGAAVITLDATWSEGYKLSASDTKVVIEDGTSKENLVTITGLVNIPTDTDNLDNYITYSNGTFTIKPGALGATDVTLAATDSDNDYTIELAADVQTTADSTSYWTPLSNGRSSYCTGAPPYYTVDGNTVKYTAASSAKTILTLNGLANTTGITVDEDEKTITIPASALGTSNVTFTSNTDGYTMELSGYTEPSSNKTWKVSGTTATLQEIPTGNKYTLSSDGKTITCTAANSTNNILSITGLKSGLTLNNTYATATHGTFAATNGIDGISLASATDAEGKTTITATIDDDVMTNTNVSISGSSDYTFELELADEQEDEGTAGWDYAKATNGNITFTYRKSVGEYYKVNTNNAAQIQYVPASNNTVYAQIAGNGFNSTITGLVTTAETAKEAAAADPDNTTKADAATNAVTDAIDEFKKYIDNTELTTNQKVSIKTDGTDPVTYLTVTNDSSKYLTVTTPTVGTVTYGVEIGSGAVSGTGTNSWSISGSSLILKKDTSAGYVYKNGKLSYAEDGEGEKIFTINGLDLTDAKATMAVLNDAQTTAAATAASETALAAVNEQKTKLGFEEDLTEAPTQPARTDVNYTTLNKIYNAYVSAYNTAYASEVADAQSENLTTYFNNTHTDYITVTDATNTVTINNALLGESNVTITNNGDATYKLATNAAVLATQRAAEAAPVDEWTLSGANATYRLNTTPAYYTTNDAGTQITYNKPVQGTVVATIKGLATTKTEYGSDAAGSVNTSEAVDAEEGTTTTTKTQTQVFYTDTKVLTANEGKIGTITTRKQQTVTTTTTIVATENGTTASTSTSKGDVTTGTPVESTFVQGIADIDDNVKTGNIKLSKNVLGTTAVTLTNSNDATFTLELDSTADVANKESVKVPAPDEISGSRTWSSSLGGTTANLTADFQEGWTLDNNKITYTAAKTGANILTLNGIKVNLSATDTAVTRAINTAKSDLVTELGLTSEDQLTAAQVRAATTTGTNNAINKWLTTDQNVVVATEAEDSGEDKGKYLVTIKNAALNNANITVKSGDNTKVYKLKLAGDVTATAATGTYSWNGLKYQSSNQAFYAPNDSNGITFTKAANVYTLATLKGIVGSSIPADNYTITQETGKTTLTLDSTLLGTTNVSLTGTDADKVELALASTGVIKDANTAKRENDGDWVISGTTATKKDGWNPYYELDTTNNKVIYHADSGTTKTFATIRGLKNGVTAITESSGTVTLTQDSVGTANVTMTDGNVTGDNTEYKLTLSGLTAPVLDNKSWNTSGVNTTLKADVAAGWNLDTNETTAIYTPAATNKALATFILGTAGFATDTATTPITLENGKLTLSKIGDNKMITIKTNPGNLSFKITDDNFDGTSSAKTTLVGSAVGEGISVTGANQIISGLGGDDVISLSGASGASVNGGVGADQIYIGSNAANVTIYGDAANDTIKGSATTGNNIFYGGAGDDSISLAAVGANITIQGETGNDEINVGDATGGLFNGGAGADKITLESASEVSIYGEAANDTIQVTNAATNATIDGGAGMDSISIGSASGGTIFGNAGNDEIYVKGDATNATIDGGAGSDIISIHGASSGLILGDVGNDEIYVDGAASGTINGGAGNDIIVVSSGAGTVIGGAGNDEVALGGTATFYYANGDGNDTVTGYDSTNNSFVLNSGEISSASLSATDDGDNLILKIGSYRVTLKNYTASGNFSYTSGGTSGKTVTVAGAGAASDLIYDTSGLLADNNLMTPNDISDLVSTNSVTEYHVGNYNTNIMAPDQILSEGDLISYGDQQKKNNK